MPVISNDASPRNWRRTWGFLLLAGLALVLLAPFLLRQKLANSAPANSSMAPGHQGSRRLVIITPHPERLRSEFGRAFEQHWKNKTGERVVVDWRVPGGTSEIAVMLKSEYAAAFERHWTRELGKKWTAQTALTFMDPRVQAEHSEARHAFLKSLGGVGADVFFGGGAYDFQIQAEAGTLVATQGSGTGIPELRARHPDWFGPGGIPERLSGEPFRDLHDRWIACCLSSFGIVYNRDVLDRLGLHTQPQQWSDLADPRYRGQIALADPGRSATVNKAFEMLIQQQMQQALTQLKADMPNADPQALEKQAVRQGWTSGLRLIQKISANARYYADSSSKIPLDVARGDAAAGMCIDYYGRTLEEMARNSATRTSRLGFVMPIGGSSVSVDPIAMFRGAPEPELATAFMEFVLSDAGQKLWAYRTGTPGGPAGGALRRLPARKDFYLPRHFQYMSDAAELPYEKAESFVYHPEWTASAFNTLRFLIRVMCVDTHVEQRSAWKSLLQAGSPPAAMAAFHDLGPVEYDAAMGPITQVVRSRNKVEETRLARSLTAFFRDRYRAAEQKAQRQP